jgi:hypothetical protein
MSQSQLNQEEKEDHEGDNERTLAFHSSCPVGF